MAPRTRYLITVELVVNEDLAQGDEADLLHEVIHDAVAEKYSLDGAVATVGPLYREST